MAVITGTNGRNTLRGTALADTIRGLGDIDSLFGLGGGDTIYGGLGNDIIDGGDGSDRLFGEAGNDTLKGGKGTDQLDGGKGLDKMAGGLGNDTYIADNAGDKATELAGQGTDLVKSSVSFTLGANVENLTLTGTAAIIRVATGNALANVITGSAIDDDLFGLGGNDKLVGGGGSDLLDGGLGNDVMIGGAGDDFYYVDSASDTVIELAGSGSDTVRTTLFSTTIGANIETVELLAGAVDATGNTLANSLNGNNAINTLRGGAGNDQINGGDEKDFMHGEAGNDLIQAWSGTDESFGGTGSDFIDTVAASNTDGIWMTGGETYAGPQDGERDFFSLGNHSGPGNYTMFAGEMWVWGYEDGIDTLAIWTSDTSLTAGQFAADVANLGLVTSVTDDFNGLLGDHKVLTLSGGGIVRVQGMQTFSDLDLATINDWPAV